MAEAPVQTPEIPPERLESVRAAVSRSVNAAVPNLEEPTTIWEIARRLSALHEEYGAAALELLDDAPSREPFAKWAEEVSRYSFETGQQVFARSQRR